MNWTRRRFLRNSGVALGASGLPLGMLSACFSDDGLRTTPGLQMPEIRSVDGLLEAVLTLDYASLVYPLLPAQSFDAGGPAVTPRNVTLRCYNGFITGPTLIARPGDRVRIFIRNRLPNDPNIPQGAPGQFNTTNLHVHGAFVSPKDNADNIFADIPPTTDYLMEFDVPPDHPPGTYWYHPHIHGSVALQVASGCAGAFIVEGDVDAVPEIAAAREHTLVFQSLVTDASGRLEDFDLIDGGDIERDFMTVNGYLRPTIVMRPGEVRQLRLIHAGIYRTLVLALDGHPLHLFSFDGDTLPHIETVDTLQLVPANKASVLIQASTTPGTYYLRRLAFGDDVPFENPVPEIVLARIVVQGEPVAMDLPQGALPRPAVLNDIADEEITGYRTLVFDVQDGVPGGYGPDQTGFLVDQQLFDAARVDQLVTLGSVEEWTVVNATGAQHPFHIHQGPFQVVAVNGVPVEPRWADTWPLPGYGTLTIRQRFDRFDGRYVLHCHMLPHEDMGMMQVVEVV
ncbi:MAG: multicopper oxidase family protein [Chromatiales bacterium]|nr:multicopper oxidase family protein [Chromatiales bacterium]